MSVPLNAETVTRRTTSVSQTGFHPVRGTFLSTVVPSWCLFQMVALVLTPFTHDALSFGPLRIFGLQPGHASNGPRPPFLGGVELRINEKVHRRPFKFLLWRPRNHISVTCSQSHCCGDTGEIRKMVSLSTCLWIGCNCTTVPPQIVVELQQITGHIDKSQSVSTDSVSGVYVWRRTQIDAVTHNNDKRVLYAAKSTYHSSWRVTHRHVAAAAGGLAGINCNSDRHDQHQQMEDEQDPWRSLNQGLGNRHRTSLFKGSNHFLQKEAELSVLHLEHIVTVY